MNQRPNFTRAESMPMEHRASTRGTSLYRADSMKCPPSTATMQQQPQQHQPANATVGPRMQCDQIIHEAMVKACEIVVRGRCSEFLDGGGSRHNETNASDGYNPRTRHGGGNHSSSYGAPSRPTQQPPPPAATTHPRATNSRFNLEVEEVSQIRTTLNAWRHNLNVPLRLDIYYEHHHHDNHHHQQQQQPQRELLERWCLDYRTPSDHGPLPLRSVCKRIVVSLRSLHCLTRMLPAHHWALRTHHHQQQQHHRIATNAIRYSIYTPPYIETTSGLPSPSFVRQALPSVPTGYGLWTIAVMYDATLSHPYGGTVAVASVSASVARWNGQEWSAGGGGSTSHPIPIQNPSSRQQDDDDDDEEEEEAVLEKKEEERRKRRTTVPLSNGSIDAPSVVVSDYIISNYHSTPPPPLQPLVMNVGHNGGNVDGNDNRCVNGKLMMKGKDDEEEGERDEQQQQQQQQRVMSGLSLAMMGEDEDTNNALSRIPPPPSQPSSNTKKDESLPSWGSPATRAAFHLPPGYMEESEAGRSRSAGEGGGREGQSGKYFVHHHGGYGYGYIGAEWGVLEGQDPPVLPPPPRMGSLGGDKDGLSISPSPLMGTPPQAMWGKPRQVVGGEEEALSRDPCVQEGALENDLGGDDVMAPPFTNPTSLQPMPSPLALRSASQSASLSHAAPSSYGSSPHHHAGLEKSSEHQRKRTSSSSVLLPPITSLDLLQKSPFSITKMMAMGTESTNGTERADSDGLAMPFILESYRDEMLTSSIPRMISADSRQRTNSIGGYTLGAAGSSSNPLLPPLGSLASISGGYYNTGPLSSTRSSGGQHSHHPIDAEEMPFAVDDDFPSMGGASNPFSGKSSKSLWGSAQGDILFNGTSTMNGVSEVTSSLAASSLHQRCATDGKPRLKLFESTQQSMKFTSRNSNGDESPSHNDYATIKDQLSDFRSFGASLMVGSIHDSRSE
ncbi:hypothetical protein HJC23_002099 [Cyclotella cryptica]|uniref:Autophagy-related protein 13 N-terminal domain-containing protein n=1 Tax=Cyclotella cryptica TaxID=29204 RepID=A0ABD3P5Y2_9STRA|eukprot:CCRYP_017125-RA/>CCRYP_017125-RA protein AED:0.01 eAED:0.01 QI:382/-1/1/1/-1/1/1/260/952